jgi:hypothetical protein
MPPAPRITYSSHFFDFCTSPHSFTPQYGAEVSVQEPLLLSHSPVVFTHPFKDEAPQELEDEALPQ